jgi:hypothetical protein
MKKTLYSRSLFCLSSVITIIIIITTNFTLSVTGFFFSQSNTTADGSNTVGTSIRDYAVIDFALRKVKLITFENIMLNSN